MNGFKLRVMKELKDIRDIQDVEKLENEYDFEKGFSPG